MDGLPALKRGLETSLRRNIEPIEKMVGPLAPRGPLKQSRTIEMSAVLAIAFSAFLLGLLVGLVVLNVRLSIITSINS